MNYACSCAVSEESILWGLPGYLGWKDIRSVYKMCNKNLLKLIGFKFMDEVYGITDYDLKCEAAKSAPIFIRQDQETMSGHLDMVFCVDKYADDQVHSLIALKSAMKNSKGEIEGVMTQGFPIDKTWLLKIAKIVLDGNFQFEKFFGSYEIGGMCKKHQLTPRQEDVVFYLLRGHTSKEIALKLEISYRTVEAHLDVLKTKFDCHTKSQLVSKCIEEGCLNMIPSHLMPKELMTAIHVPCFFGQEGFFSQ